MCSYTETHPHMYMDTYIWTLNTCVATQTAVKQCNKQHTEWRVTQILNHTYRQSMKSDFIYIFELVFFIFLRIDRLDDLTLCIKKATFSRLFSYIQKSNVVIIIKNFLSFVSFYLLWHNMLFHLSLVLSHNTWSFDLWSSISTPMSLFCLRNTRTMI